RGGGRGRRGGGGGAGGRGGTSTISPASPQPMPGGTWSHQVSAVDVRCSAASRAPSLARNSSRRPGSPVSGSRSDPASGSGTVTQVWQPSDTVTSAWSARASASATAGVDTVTGTTTALPPPWMAGRTAFGPITATRLRVAASTGSAPRSLRSRTSDAAVALRSSEWSTSTVLPLGDDPPRADTVEGT